MLLALWSTVNNAATPGGSGAIVTRSTRLIQPQGPVELDYTNPLLQGHSFLWSAAHDVRKSLIGSQRLATVVGGYAPSTEGISWKAASGKPVAFPLGENFISTSDGVGTGDFTIWVLANPDITTTPRDLVTQANTTSGPDAGCIALRSSLSNRSMSFLVGKGTTAGNFDTLTAETDQVDGSVKLFMGRRQGTELSLWTDGRKVASGTYAIRQVRPFVSGSYNSSAFSIGCNTWSTSTAGVHNNIMAGGANRALSDDEIARLSSNPWQLFRPVQRRVYFDMGAGGGIGLNLVDIHGNQINSGSFGDVTQTHQVSATNSISDTVGSASSILQTHALSGTFVAQDNNSTSNAITLIQSLLATAASQDNIATSGSIAQAGSFSATPTNQTITASAGSISQIQSLSASQANQNNASTTAPITQIHLLAASLTNQSNIDSSEAITQIHSLSATSSTQVTISTSGTIVQESVSSASAGNQHNSTSLGAITQIQHLAGASSQSKNIASSQSILQVIDIETGSANQQAISSSTSIAQTHSIQAQSTNQETIGSIASISTVHVIWLGTSESIQNNLESVSSISQDHSLAGQLSTTKNIAISGLITQVHEFYTSAANQSNIDSGEAITQVHEFYTSAANQSNISIAGQIVAIDYPRTPSIFTATSPLIRYSVDSPERHYVIDSPLIRYSVDSPERHYVIDSPIKIYQVFATK